MKKQAHAAVSVGSIDKTRALFATAFVMSNKAETSHNIFS